MENASKALLMAAFVLIAILLLTLFSYLFTKMSEESSRIIDTIQQNEKQEFNQPFLIFDNIQERTIGKDNEGNDIKGFLTAQDVVTIMNLAQDNNKHPKYPTIIKITYKNGRDLATEDTKDWLNNNANGNQKYGCEVIINPNTLVVEEVKITDIP